METEHRIVMPPRSGRCDNGLPCPLIRPLHSTQPTSQRSPPTRLAAKRRSRATGNSLTLNAPRQASAAMSTPPIVARWIGYAPYLLSLLRMVAASLFLQYGATKLFGFPASVMPGGGTAALTSLAGIAGLLEFTGGSFSCSDSSPGRSPSSSRDRWRSPITWDMQRRDRGRS